MPVTGHCSFVCRRESALGRVARAGSVGKARLGGRVREQPRGRRVARGQPPVAPGAIAPAVVSDRSGTIAGVAALPLLPSPTPTPTPMALSPLEELRKDAELRLLAHATGEHLPCELVERVHALRARQAELVARL
jgi:hypothetical protein